MKKKIMAMIAACTLVLSLGVQGAGAAETITLSGSSALLPIVKQAAADYMAAHKDVTINVAGGGSGTGLQQVTAGIVTIGNSDVYADASSGLVDHQVCIEPFLFIVNTDVLVAGLTHDQIVGIFSGKITNWKQVGGKNQKISVIMRQASSGTRMTIQKDVMGNEQFTTNAVVMDSAGAVRTAVERTPGAIGYVDLAYMSAHTRRIRYDGVTPSIENVKNGTYKLNAIGHMYTKGEATGAAKDFINYILSDNFQNKTMPQFNFVQASAIKKLDVNKVQINKK